jgi:hypothetical protein
MSLAWIGWVATAVFASSYLCREAASLRRVQAAPVIVANLIVAGVALASSLRLSRPPRIALCKASHSSKNQ